MPHEVTKDAHKSILFFIFANAISCGVVFLGLISSFSYMLIEYGFSISKISLMFLASSPYSLKFLISPFIIKLLDLKAISKSPHKALLYITQVLTIGCMTTLGFVEADTPIVLIMLIIFLTALSASAHDIIGDHIRLISFKGRKIGTATSIGTVGFRIGMLISGAGILHLSNRYGWTWAFFIVSLIHIFSTIATFFLPKISNDVKFVKNITLRKYIKTCFVIFKRYGLVFILVLTFSFKFSDSVINSLKAMFLHLIGISKADFANISQILGTGFIVLGGGLAGVVCSKIKMKHCLILSFISLLIASTSFLIISIYNISSLTQIAVLINIATLCFGFSSVLYRTFVSIISNRNVNTYTLLISIGSLFRVISSYVGGIIADISWSSIFTLCLLFTIPGLLFTIMKKAP